MMVFSNSKEYFMTTFKYEKTPGTPHQPTLKFMTAFSIHSSRGREGKMTVPCITTTEVRAA
jgi:hypothetical protein